MDEELAMQIIQRYRHDILNHLQLVSGYLTIQKPEKAEEKVNDWIRIIEEERKLTNLDTPKFTLWIFRFTELYKNFTLTYDIQLEDKNYRFYDELLYNYGFKVMDILSEMIHPTELYPIMLQLKETKNALHMILNVEGNFLKTDNDILESFKIDKDKVICQVEHDNHSYEVDVVIFK